MFRTIFTTLRALLKSGLCRPQLCIRSDTASYLAYLPQLSISIQYCFCKWVIQNTQSNKGSFNVTIKARISQLRGHTSPNYDQPTSPLSQRSIVRAAYLQGQPSSLNIIDAAIQHFLLVLLPFMVLPTLQEYHSSLLKQQMLY